jgi:hypothetical protein
LFVDWHLEENTDWSKVLFTDESYFEIGSDNRKLWRRRGDYREEVVEEESVHPIKLMVWRWIARNFKTPLMVFKKGETMNAATYVQKIWIETDIIEMINQMQGRGN